MLTQLQLDVVLDELDPKGSAERGALMLDQTRPDWFNVINLQRLNLADGSDCIIGQLSGTYLDGRGEILRQVCAINGITVPDEWHGFENLSQKYGFVIDDEWVDTRDECTGLSFYENHDNRMSIREAGYRRLTEAWTAEILLRRAIVLSTAN